MFNPNVQMIIIIDLLILLCITYRRGEPTKTKCARSTKTRCRFNCDLVCSCDAIETRSGLDRRDAFAMRLRWRWYAAEMRETRRYHSRNSRQDISRENCMSILLDGCCVCVHSLLCDHEGKILILISDSNSNSTYKLCREHNHRKVILIT